MNNSEYKAMVVNQWICCSKEVSDNEIYSLTFMVILTIQYMETHYSGSREAE